MAVVPLAAIAHSRAGDKGDTLHLSLIAFDRSHFPILAGQVSAARVLAWFAPEVRGPVERYEVPGLGALNFVLHGALDGGVTRSLRLDPHGKSLSARLLAMPVEVSD